MPSLVTRLSFTEVAVDLTKVGASQLPLSV
jgi:hypothetical protein